MATEHPPVQTIKLTKQKYKSKRRPIQEFTDPVTQAQYRAWTLGNAQATFRGETWDLTFEQYQAAWAGYWHLKGRGSADMCLARKDTEGAWTPDNINVIPRRDHCQRQKRVLESYNDA